MAAVSPVRLKGAIEMTELEHDVMRWGAVRSILSGLGHEQSRALAAIIQSSARKPLDPLLADICNEAVFNSGMASEISAADAIAIAGMRYFLGRHTGAVFSCITSLNSNWDGFSAKTQETMIREITAYTTRCTNAGDHEALMDRYEVTTWALLLANKAPGVQVANKV